MSASRRSIGSPLSVVDDATRRRDRSAPIEPAPDAPTPMEVLVVDDEVAAAELIVHELRRAGFDPTICHVTSRDGLVADHTCSPDIVILDYSIPGLRGEDALLIALAAWPDVPVIFVTGTIGEDHAVELLRLGATDYVLKDRLGRLDMVVRRALRERADRKDITRLEAGLRAIERMELMGRLAGGIAHDFRNLVQAADGFAQVALNEVPPRSQAAADLAEVRSNLARAASLIKQLMLIGRSLTPTPVPLELASVMRDLEPTMRRLLGPEIELAWRPGPVLGRILADHSQLEQVILNLVANARDAMPEGGRLTIQAQDVDITDAQGATSVVRPGPYIALSVTDTGAGMTEDVQRHLFEPFFTTKDPGKGTGLGLASVRSIVIRAGGGISARSTPGEGSVFHVLWPRADGLPASSAAS